MNTKLARELRAIGASKREAAELAHAADRLKHVHVPGMSEAARQRVASRLPVDVANAEPERHVSWRWVAAGGFAVLAVVAVAGVLLWPGSTQPSSPAASQTAKPKTSKTKAIDQQLQQQAQQLQELQTQPTVDQKAVQKAKTDFQRDYQQYTSSHAQDKSFKDSWSDYQTQWWWKAGVGSGASSQQTSAPSTQTTDTSRMSHMVR